MRGSDLLTAGNAHTMAESNSFSRYEERQLTGRQRRFLVLLFSDLSRSTHLLASMDTEEYAELFAELRARYAEVLERHGGLVSRVIGDGLLACFGYPHAREDDGRRAVEAAIELHEVVKRTGRPGLDLNLHTGVHAGLVLLEPGDEVSGRLVLTGAAANLAARLAEAAAQDEILVSGETLGAERHFFQTDNGRALALRGVDRPVHVWRILAKAPERSRFEARARRGLTPFVGRASELELLRSQLADAMAGSSRNLAVVAPPGQGKTRLAEQFLSGVDRSRVHVLRGYCESYLSAAPLQPFLQMLRSVFGITYEMSSSTASAALRAALGRICTSLLAHEPVLLNALSLGTSPTIRDPALVQRSIAGRAEAILAVFDALARQRPLMIFIDDWQWADDATRQLLAKVRALSGNSLFTLIAARQTANERLGLAGARLLNLRPLTPAESDDVIQQLVQSANTFEIEQIRNDAGGNPLFLEELCRSLADDGARTRTGKTHSETVWLNKLIEARFERLPHEQKEIVRMAAVVGNVVPQIVLEKLSGRPANDPVFGRLAEQDLIYTDEQAGTLRFKHGIVRNVIYEKVGLAERRSLHLRICTALRQTALSADEEGLYEQLSYHFSSAGEWAQAAQYAELAGDKAISTSALDRAQLQYKVALDALSRTRLTPQTYRRWLLIARRLGMVCVFDPSVESLELLRQAIEIADRFEDERARGHAEYWVGYVHYALGDFRHATEYLELALGRAKRLGEEDLAKWCGATLGQACAAAGQYARARQLLGEAIDAKRAQKRISRPAVGYAYSLACQASVLGDQGEFDAAQECFEAALDAIDGAGHEVEGSISCWQSGVLLWRGRWKEARLSAVRAEKVAERVKSLYLYSMGRALGGYATWMDEQDPGALKTILEATTWLEREHKSLFISLNFGWLSEILVAYGQLHSARQYATRALRRARDHDRLGGAMACRALARAAATGRYNRTPAHYLMRAAQNAALRQSPHELAMNTFCEAELAHAEGRQRDWQALAMAAAEGFQNLGMHWHLDRVQSLLRT